MDPGKDRSAADAFAAKCEEARSDLRKRMAEHGLHEKDGWRIHESMREAKGGTLIVMRPIHSKLAAPPDLECNCSIDEPGTDISSQCDP